LRSDPRAPAALTALAVILGACSPASDPSDQWSDEDGATTRVRDNEDDSTDGEEALDCPLGASGSPCIYCDPGQFCLGS
jgi:hypothetical protein